MACPLVRLLVVTSVSALIACGGRPAGTAGEAKPEVDRDPLAMLPPSAVLFARIDLRAVYGDPAVGAQVAAITDPLVPVGDGTWFLPSRDVDRAVVGVYATPEPEVAAILSGRFDVDNIAHATHTTGGAPVSTGPYGGFVTSSVGRMTWVALTPRTLVAGSSEGVRLVLDRIQRGAPERSIPPWIVATLETPGASSALTADFVSQPVMASSFANLNLSWLKGLRIARVVGDMSPPGLNVAGTLTYGDPATAQGAVAGMRAADRWLELLGPLVGGLKLQGFDATGEGNDLRCKFAVDMQGLRALLAMIPRFLRPASQ